MFPSPKPRVFARAIVREVYCPECQAKPFQNCVGKRNNVRISNHIQRIEWYNKVYPQV